MAASLLGIDPYDTLQIALGLPKILDLAPSELVGNMLKLKYEQRAETRTSKLIAVLDNPITLRAHLRNCGKLEEAHLSQWTCIEGDIGSALEGF